MADALWSDVGLSWASSPAVVLLQGLSGLIAGHHAVHVMIGPCNVHSHTLSVANAVQVAALDAASSKISTSLGAPFEKW